MKKIILFSALLAQALFGLAYAQYRAVDPSDENDPDAPRIWSEIDLELPKEGPSNDLRTFYVSNTTSLIFEVDAKSISIGKDDVIRYIMVITSPSGARQITYEGIRCEKYESRHYASYQILEKRWVKNPYSKWDIIHGGGRNRYHAALAQDAFCDFKNPRRNREEILRLLKP